jgi:hypothetical protein
MREDEDKVMNTPNELLRREELIEQASLDALGLLDEFEAAHYARSFHAAPASVQEEIRRLQAAVATDAALLADEEPPADLRAKVMGSVREAMDEEARELKPIATIGAKSQRGSAAVTVGLVERERVSLAVRRAERLVSIWRAASVGLAASLVAAVVWAMTLDSNVQMVERLLQNELAVKDLESSKAVAPTLRSVILAQGRTVYSLAGVDPKAGVGGQLFHLPEDGGKFYILCFGLPTNGKYRVRVMSSSGSHDLGPFVSGAGVSGCWLASAELNGASLLRIEVVDQNGDAVMKSNLL